MNQKILIVICLVLAFGLGSAMTWIYKSQPEPIGMNVQAFDELFDDRFLNGSRSPFEEMDRIRERMDRSFGLDRSIFDRWFRREFGDVSIAQIHTRETESEILYEIDIGTQDAQNVEVVTEHGYVQIRADLSDEADGLKKQTTISQRFPIPPNVVHGSTEILQKDGKLIVSFDKRIT